MNEQSVFVRGRTVSHEQITQMEARIAQLEEALRESWCWRWTGDSTTPEQLGAKLNTFDEVIRMVNAALAQQPGEWLEKKLREAKAEVYEKQAEAERAMVVTAYSEDDAYRNQEHEHRAKFFERRAAEVREGR